MLRITPHALRLRSGPPQNACISVPHLKAGRDRFIARRSDVPSVNSLAERLELAVPTDVHHVAKRLRDEGHQVFLVGGAVRNGLLKIPIADWDLCTSAPPDAVRSLFHFVENTGFTAGTVTVRATHKKGLPIHVSSFREYAGHAEGEPKKVKRALGKSLEGDLMLRDFTINAIAMNLETGTLIDPSGGRQDLAQQTIRAVGEPRERFLEDPRRILRAYRFAAKLGFQIDPAISATAVNCGNWLMRIKRQRIRNELLQILEVEKPSVAFELMRKDHVLSVVLPELVACQGIRGKPQHRHDLYEILLATCDLLPASHPELRLAGLLHDIGKTQCRVPQGHGVFIFPEHERLGADLALQIMHRWKFKKAQIEFVTILVREHGFEYKPAWDDAQLGEFMKQVPPAMRESLFMLRVADVNATGKRRPDFHLLDEMRRRMTELEARQRPAVLAVDGSDVMTALDIRKSSPVVGKILRWLRAYVQQDVARNTREHLLQVLATPPDDLRTSAGL